MILVVPALGALACGGSGSKEAETPAGPAQAAEAPKPAALEAAKPAEAAPAKPASGSAPSSVEEASFSLKMVGAGPYKAGDLGRFVLNLEPRGVFHVNQEYPIEITLKGDADTSFPKASLMRPDAAEFNDKKARFDVPFTAKAAGEHKILANVKFAVCTDENCVPDERDLALAVAVN
jgi:hypothetical protein